VWVSEPKEHSIAVRLAEECGAEGTIDNEKLRSTLKKIEQGWREARPPR
jgi:hypothetical protein